MDLLVNVVDQYALQPYVYNPLFEGPAPLVSNDSPFSLHEGDIGRQALSLYLILCIGGYLLYFSVAGLSYLYLWKLRPDHFFPDRDQWRRLPNIKKEIRRAVTSVPWMSALTLPLTLPELRGYSKLYTDVSDYGVCYLIFSALLFIVFADSIVYWTHRLLHWGAVYKYIHKDHHAYVTEMSPFASHAFHPLDGWSQSIPYHVFVYLWPMNRFLYIGLFVIVNCWTISIHDMVDLCSEVQIFGWKFLLSSGHHFIHHKLYNYNFGQYTTFWDKLCGTHYEVPDHVKKTL